MAVWKLKSCPRCGGDLFMQREKNGWDEACLACGYRRDISNAINVNTVGQVKVNHPMEISHKLQANSEFHCPIDTLGHVTSLQS